MSTVPIDLGAWARERTDPRTAEFRQAIHTILRALERVQGGSAWLALKGAVLLSIRYEFTRMTRDIDFSTARPFGEFDTRSFLANLDVSLTEAVEALPYGLACRIQSHEVRPARQDANYQTLHIGIGYAPKGDPARLSRLMRLQSPVKVTIDLSFNEPLCRLEILDEGGDLRIPAYALSDFFAEKLRAILQQPSRNRYRPQDALDLHVLLARPETVDPEFKRNVFSALTEKSAARELPIDRASIRHPEVRRRSETDYALLAHEITIDLPAFEQVFEAVAAYYESLPWGTLGSAAKPN